MESFIRRFLEDRWKKGIKVFRITCLYFLFFLAIGCVKTTEIVVVVDTDYTWGDELVSIDIVGSFDSKPSFHKRFVPDTESSVQEQDLEASESSVQEQDLEASESSVQEQDLEASESSVQEQDLEASESSVQEQDLEILVVSELPVSFTVYPSDPSDSRRIRLEVIGTVKKDKKDSVTISRIVETKFIFEKSGAFGLWILKNCEVVKCESDQSCFLNKKCEDIYFDPKERLCDWNGEIDTFTIDYRTPDNHPTFPDCRAAENQAVENQAPENQLADTEQ